jgi:DNA repair exonuclease SbcCD ATPase subunit
MKKIIFETVTIKNFLSVGENELNLNFNSGISLITGDNKDTGGKNGIGKSTITDAIYWNLFGNTLRDLKKDKILHNKSKNNGKVDLTFKVEGDDGVKNYKISRYLEPSKIVLFCDSVDITPSTIPSTDELIKKIIGGNEEVFKNSVIMSANNTLPFMAQKKIEKRKFIEGILQLDIFSDMLLKIRAEYNEYKKENDLLSNDFINQQKNLEIFEKQKLSIDEIKKNKIQIISDKIENNKTEIQKNKNLILENNNDLDKKIKILNEKNSTILEGIKKIQNESNQILSDKAEVSSELNQYKKEKQKFIEKGDSCPVCNREYCKQDIQIVEEKIKELDVFILNKTDILNSFIVKQKEFNEKLVVLNNGVEKIKSKILQYTNQKQKNIIIEQKIENLLEKNKEYEEDILKINTEKYDYDKNIKDCNTKIENLNEKLLTIKKHLQVLDSCKFIVSEDGVKTFIIKKILKILNERLNFYLKTFDAPCECEFNDSFEETIFNEQGKECSYFNFSGGERKRIDVAVLFMFQDILRLHSGISYSLNMYDELFDSALDDLGIDKILNVLKIKVEKYKESVYIISHKASTKTNIDNVILLEKENGQTKIVS